MFIEGAATFTLIAIVASSAGNNRLTIFIIDDLDAVSKDYAVRTVWTLQAAY